MGYMIEYKCGECDFELVYCTRLFYYDADLRETIDYTFCKATVDWDKKSEIKGEMIETYCSHCNKYVKVYTILKVGSYSKEAYELIKEGINNNANKKIEELQAQLNQIEKDVRGEDYLDRNMIKAPAKLTAILSEISTISPTLSSSCLVS